MVIITLQNDFGQSLAAGFKEVAEKYGITIVNEYQYAIKDRQFGAIVAKVKADIPDCHLCLRVLFHRRSPWSASFGPQVLRCRSFGQEGYDSQKFIEIAGKAAEGVIITTSLDRDSTVP